MLILHNVLYNRTEITLSVEIKHYLMLNNHLKRNDANIAVSCR